MTAKEFVRIVKKHSVDGIADSLLQGPRRLASMPTSSEQPQREPPFIGIVSIDRAISNARETVKWLDGLAETDRRKIQSLLQDCSELSVASFLNVLDGTGGEFIGVFEILAVSDETRTLVNPENSEMLHDLFAEVCKEDSDM